MLGTWAHEEYSDTIATRTKQDNGYVLEITEGSSMEKFFQGKYQKGVLVFSSLLPSPDVTVSYNKDTDQIHVGGPTTLFRSGGRYSQTDD